ncbi:MAG TPA: hypothetical protein VN653_18150 [Anaerolineales bacterium]|nr:hypothetical protein [Anaerolineales bacterium]
MKRNAFLLAILLALSLTFSAAAQSNYYFSVKREVVHVYLNADGSMSLDYTWDFVNQPGAHAIDFVDVGMPNSNFVMNSISAEVNGKSVRVSSGDYQGNGTGFAVVLGPQSIPAGGSGTVHVSVGSVGNVLFPDSQDGNYASNEFEPTYFGSQYVTGSTDLTLSYHFPPGVKLEEPRWHNAPSGFPSEPQAGFDDQGRITYSWQNTNASISRQYVFGVSFPKSYVPEGSIVTQPAFDFGGLVTTIMNSLGTILCVGFFGFLFVGIPVLTAYGNRRRKLQYMAPRISIEGHGIKRGLTAVEAAILMGEPLDKVMTMILFGVIKKNAAQVVVRDPLKVNVASPTPDGLYEYELNFLKALKEENTKTRRNLLQDMTVKLVRSVSEKMKGFSRRETLDYYQSIMEKAWAQVEAAGTPEVKSQKFDEALEWTMLDRNYDDRTRRVFHGPVFVPTWWGRYDPSYSRSAPASSGIPSAPMTMPSVPHLPGSDFASSVANGVQTFSQKVIGNVTDFTSRVTNVTNPPPPPPKNTGGNYRGGSGGRSCACACACAGCACACAGGGR